MTLWIVLTVMIAVAACGLTIPLVRNYESRRHDLSRATPLDVLKTQLSEVESQRASGALAENEAEGLATEIKRRILAETRDAPPAARPFPIGMMPGLALGLVAVIALSATGLYALMGHPAPIAAATPAPADVAQQAAQHPMGDVASMIAGLENKLQQNPNDAEGWQMLGWSYMRTGRPADAAKAYGRAVALDPKNNEYLSAQGEAMAQADGRVSDGAASIFRRAQAADPADPRARYFLAMYKDQQGDHQGAMSDWITLIKSAPADAPWLGDVRSYVEGRAKEEGIDISKRLPPANMSPAAPATPPQAASGPTEAQVAAAGQMPDSDRSAMIHGMVDKLAAELKANPRDADGWVRLMRARMVLGEKDQAAAAYRDARKAFAGAPSELAALHQAAQSLSIPD
jgi:cytochrome c-type biogenesis protein CcmH